MKHEGLPKEVNKSAMYRKQKDLNEETYQWLKWNKNSCRLDVFFSIVVLCIINDTQFDLNLLVNEESQELKRTLALIAECTDIDSIQNNVNNFAKYREYESQEKIGEQHSITPLFSLFGELKIFQFQLKKESLVNVDIKITEFFLLAR